MTALKNLYIAVVLLSRDIRWDNDGDLLQTCVHRHSIPLLSVLGDIVFEFESCQLQVHVYLEPLMFYGGLVGTFCLSGSYHYNRDS